nr:hypothetical protein [Tanacetum cinerariifolium]
MAIIVIQSGVEELVPILSENEVTSEDKRDYDVLVCDDSSTFDICDDHSEILFDSKNNDDISSNDDAFEDIERYFSNHFDVVLREKLLSINRLNANIGSLNDNPTPDRMLNSFASFPIFKESDTSLSDNSSPEFETFSDHMEETRSGITTTHAHKSLPEYDSFFFEIVPDQERLTSVFMKDISDDSTNDLLLEEVDLFLASDNSIPLDIENFSYDSETDICFLKELLIDDSIPLLVNKSSDSDHQDDLSFPRPLPEPPDVEFFFNLKPDVIAEEISDESFDPEGEIDVFVNVEDDDYFPFMFVIRIFLPYLIYPE